MSSPVVVADSAPRTKETFAMEDPYASRRRLLSPLEIHFSQSHIRLDFQDGRPVEGAIPEIGRELVTPTKPEAPGGAPSDGNDWWLLKPPFPEIEVIQWRCKLREEDGSIRLDEFGNELYGDREWYTLDNRRLYCLQRAAAKLYPAEVRCPVVVIHQEDGNYREFRKFRTVDRGRTIGLLQKDGPELPRWSWRRQVGLAEEVLSAGSAIAKSSKKRGFTSGRRAHHGRYFGRNCADDEEEEERTRWDVLMNISYFVLIYVMLRIVVQVGRRLLTMGAGGASFRQA